MLASTDPAALGLDPALGAAGVNGVGVLAVPVYDASVPEGWRSRDWLPEARSAVVLATGGSGFYRAFQASPEAAGAGRHPLDAFLARVLDGATRREARSGFPAVAAGYFQRRTAGDGRGPERFADFVGLAERAGLGRPSRLGILVHPVFGPWIAIRGLLLTARRLEPTRPDPAFRGCDGCPAPCEAACPGSAVTDSGFELARCLDTSKELAACRVGCAARRACVLGPEHRHSPVAEARFRAAALAAAPPPAPAPPEGDG